MTLTHPLLEPLRELQRAIRDEVVRSFREHSIEALSAVAEDGEGDTLYAVDKISEALLVQTLGARAEELGGIVLVAEGLLGGQLILPEGRSEAACRYRVLVDPIDGTRGLMYQKRPGWVLSGVAENRGSETRLRHVELAVQTEIPLLKQYLADELWSVRGAGARAERVNLLNGERSPLELRPSKARSIEHGFASVSRFFPGARAELAAIDEELVQALLGAPVRGKASCFEDQYASTGGQLYELSVGHDRFIADLRPLLRPLLAERGLELSLCCHPYDVSGVLIAEELGVVVRAPEGGPLDCALNVEEDVAWVGYANAHLAERIEPLLQAALARRGLLRSHR